MFLSAHGLDVLAGIKNECVARSPQQTAARRTSRDTVQLMVFHVRVVNVMVEKEGVTGCARLGWKAEQLDSTPRK